MWPDPKFLLIWLHLLKKSLMVNFIFCAVFRTLSSIYGRIHLCWYICEEQPFTGYLQSKCSGKFPKMFIRKFCDRDVASVKWPATIHKNTASQVFSCEYNETLQNKFYIEQLWATINDHRFDLISVNFKQWLYKKFKRKQGSQKCFSSVVRSSHQRCFIKRCS